MQKRPTDELMGDLLKSNNIDEYMKDNAEYMIDGTLAKYLDELLEEKGLTKAEVIRASQLNEIYAYQIFAGSRMPSRDKLICLCFGMKLIVEETQQLLKAAGFAPLYPKNKRDSIIIYALNNGHEVMKVNSKMDNENFELLST